MESRRNGPQLSSRHDDDDDGVDKRVRRLRAYTTADSAVSYLNHARIA